MFSSDTNTIVGSYNIDQYAPKRVATSVFNNTLAAGQQKADARNFSSPFRGRGIQAGSPGQRYFQQQSALGGLLDARSAAQGAAMGIYEANRDAQLKAQVGQAQEYARMTQVANDQNEADWSERFTQESTDQAINQARRQYQLEGQQLGNRLAQGLLSGLRR